MADYPKRPSFFAYRFCRLMAKVCLANDVTPAVCWLLTTIAHTEDAKGYRGPVTFFNEQLMAVTGYNSADALDRARKKAVDAGWLHYQPGGKGTAGRYWVLVPEQFKSFDDAPSDESSSKYFRENAEENGEANELTTAKTRRQPKLPPLQSGENPETTRKETRKEPGDNPEASAEHSSLTLKTLKTLPQEEEGPTAEEFARAWNELGKPFSRIIAIAGSRLTHFQARRRECFWRENWRAALATLPTRSFLRGESGRGWVADCDWFLKPLSVQSIIEGKYADGPGPPAKKSSFETQDERNIRRMHEVMESTNERPHTAIE